MGTDVCMENLLGACEQGTDQKYNAAENSQGSGIGFAPAISDNRFYAEEALHPDIFATLMRIWGYSAGSAGDSGDIVILTLAA